MKTPSDPKGGAKQPQDKICWNIWRFSKDHPTVKVYGTNCPCDIDRENNPNCPMYEEVNIY
jgi:hypothetical protein